MRSVFWVLLLAVSFLAHGMEHEDYIAVSYNPKLNRIGASLKSGNRKIRMNKYLRDGSIDIYEIIGKEIRFLKEDLAPADIVKELRDEIARYEVEIKKNNSIIVE